MSLKESHYLLNYQINSVVYVDYDEISLVLPSYSLCSISCNSCCVFADSWGTSLSAWSLPTAISWLPSLAGFALLTLWSCFHLGMSLFVPCFRLKCVCVCVQSKAQKL